MRIGLFTIVLLIFYQISFGQTPIKEQLFAQTFEGTIAGKYPIVMYLVNWGNGTLTGEYFYKKVGKKINIYGEFVNDNQFTIKEYVGDEFTGSFTGTFIDANHIKGNWSDSKNVKNLSFEIKSAIITLDKSGWTGAWHLNDVWDGGTLLIGGVTKDSLKFALSVVRSAHIGEIWGTAKRLGNQAVFKQVEFPMEGEENPEACHLIFELKGDYIEIEQQSSGLACGFGMRAYASGRFDNKIIEIKPTLSFGEGEDKIFPNQATHDGFKHLVGEKYYDVFAYNMQGFAVSDATTDNGFPATVAEGAVYGLFSTNEAIIMYNKNAKYWAMTIDMEGEELVLRYFTNDTKYKIKFPPSIVEWADRFANYPIRYESK